MFFNSLLNLNSFDLNLTAFFIDDCFGYNNVILSFFRDLKEFIIKPYFFYLWLVLFHVDLIIGEIEKFWLCF